MLIDLDPQECPFDLIVDAALLVKRILDRIGLTGYPKTTGGDGMHVYIPLRAGLQLRRGAHVRGADRAPGGAPSAATCSPRRASVAKRQKNRVYFDYLQIGKVEDHRRARTCCGPIRARRWRRRSNGARCATACIPASSPSPTRSIASRDKGDLFAGVLDRPQRLEDALVKLEKLFSETA